MRTTKAITQMESLRKEAHYFGQGKVARISNRRSGWQKQHSTRSKSSIASSSCESVPTTNIQRMKDVAWFRRHSLTASRLLFMTYNGWVMLAVAVGAFLGYLSFGEGSATKSVACH